VAPRSSQDLTAELRALEVELEQQQAQLSEAEEAFAALERQRAQISDTASRMREAISGLEHEVSEGREAVARAECDEAKHVLDQAVAKRDRIALRVAQALGRVLEQVDALDAARADTGAAHARLTQLQGPRNAEPLPPEPRELVEPWERLLDRVRTEVDDGLVEELLDAAARSPLGHAIDDLPAHLREPARQRRQLLLKSARGRKAIESNGASPSA
jgi:chromosome segregation ATPase